MVISPVKSDIITWEAIRTDLLLVFEPQRLSRGQYVVQRSFNQSTCGKLIKGTH